MRKGKFTLTLAALLLPLGLGLPQVSGQVPGEIQAASQIEAYGTQQAQFQSFWGNVTEKGYLALNGNVATLTTAEQADAQYTTTAETFGVYSKMSSLGGMSAQGWVEGSFLQTQAVGLQLQGLRFQHCPDPFNINYRGDQTFQAQAGPGFCSGEVGAIGEQMLQYTISCVSTVVSPVNPAGLGANSSGPSANGSKGANGHLESSYEISSFAQLLPPTGTGLKASYNQSQQWQVPAVLNSGITGTCTFTQSTNLQTSN